MQYIWRWKYSLGFKLSFGIVAAFLAKGLEPSLAAAAGAAAQQIAASLVPQQSGLVAGDVVEALPRALG